MVRLRYSLNKLKLLYTHIIQSISVKLDGVSNSSITKHSKIKRCFTQLFNNSQHCVHCISVTVRTVKKDCFMELFSFLSSARSFSNVSFSSGFLLLFFFFSFDLFRELPWQVGADGKERGEAQENIVDKLPGVCTGINNQILQPLPPVPVKHHNTANTPDN